MKTLFAVLLTLFTVCSVKSQPIQILQEWDFGKAADTLGWKLAEDITRFEIKNGALQVSPGKGIAKLMSPVFALPANDGQYVEVVMKSDKSGQAYLYFSNTAEEPYGGFRPGQFAVLNIIGDRKFRAYRALPFWQTFRKIIHIRLDPPGENVSIKAIRILQDTQPAVSKNSWEFKDGIQGWKILSGEGSVQASQEGIRLTGNGFTQLFSPPISLDSEHYEWATIRFRSNAKNDNATLLFVNDSDIGIQSIPIEIKPGDTVSRSYRLTGVNTWRGTVKRIGIIPSASADKGESITIHGVYLGTEPAGPPCLEFKYLGLKGGVVRRGKDFTLQAYIRNAGGGAIRDATATISLKPLPKQVVSIKEIAPGETALAEWTFSSKDIPNLTEVVCSVSSSAGNDKKKIRVRVLPELPTEVSALKYVPEPVIPESDYLVGAYYFPGWHQLQRWQVLDEFPERRPILGYYREGNPEVADWHINWMASHGINFIIYDWYWYQGSRMLEHGLHDGFLKSKHQDKMKLCLLWANHNQPVTMDAEEDLLNVTRFWIENYFKHPNHLKINGKNVMVIFDPRRIRDDMGSSAKVRHIFNKMRSLCEEAGVGGLYLVACTYPGKNNVQQCLDDGYDALSGYNYPIAGYQSRMFAPYKWMLDGYREYWNLIDNDADIPYIPVCEPGWDSRPWHGAKSLVRTGKTPELWKQMLTNARQFVDTPKRRLPEGQKMVFLEAWNEFGEGDYIEPHAEFGFDHVEAVRQVFAPKSKAPVILTPDDIGMGPYEFDYVPVMSSWDFSQPESQSWSVGNMSDLYYTDGVMSAKAMNNDPAFYSPETDIDADKKRFLEIRMSMDKGSTAEIFFARRGQAMSQSRSVKFPVIADGNFHTYKVDMGQNSNWRGKIYQIRLDPNSEAGSAVKVAWIKSLAQ